MKNFFKPKFLFLFAIILLNLLSCVKSDFAQVELQLKTPELKQNQTVYITGNKEELGSWQPDKIKMDKINDSIWIFKTTFPVNSQIEFKFTLGSWDTEALDENKKVMNNFKVHIDKKKTISFTIINWKSDRERFENGIIWYHEYLKNLSYAGLLNRDVIVLLPPSYFIDTTKRYPVLYMHDGQNIADPNTSAFGMEWKIDEVCDSLIKEGEMNEIIIVGIFNTADRYFEYSYSDKGKIYIDFIINKLKPIIDNNYRTLPDRENTATMGASMGGLVSLIMAWEYSKYFSKAGCLSPAILYTSRNLDYTPLLLNDNFPEYPIKLYIDNGGLGIDSTLQEGVEKSINTLTYNKGFIENQNLIYIIDKNAEHNEIAWSNRIHIPLKFFFGRK